MATHHASRAPVPPRLQYSFVLGIEENFDYPGSLRWFSDNWTLPLILGILVYLPVLYFGQIIMAKREPFKLRPILMLWNGGLALFSIIGFLRVLPEFISVLTTQGFYQSVCSPSYGKTKPTAFWIYLFVLSKTPELVDTVFLVLKKQRLIFLHVYHHASVLIFAWYVYQLEIANARWFCVMNFGIHSVMYSYYVLKAMPDIIRVPKVVSIMITASQTLQMVIGAFVISASWIYKLTGKRCATTGPMVAFGLFIYISYLFLFSQFFYYAYCSAKPLKDGKTGNSLTDKKRA